jgi:carboxymethylenebutenolidase
MCTLDGCGTHKDMPPIVLSEIDRRAFLAGTMTLPLATVLAFPDLAAAQGAKMTALDIPAGVGGKAQGVVAMPAKLPAPAVILIHEWWGLNDQIKAVAAELAELGYIAYAIDLYGGQVADSPQGARALMKGLDAKKANAQLAAAVAHLRGMEGANGKIGTIGWCFGGGWSLNASVAAPVDATVIYYGRVNVAADKLAKLSGPVLGHFGTLDKNINKKMVAGFETEMGKAGKSDSLSVNWYEADHAFANPSGARYDAEDAALAWARTRSFFEENLKG